MSRRRGSRLGVLTAASVLAAAATPALAAPPDITFQAFACLTSDPATLADLQSDLKGMIADATAQHPEVFSNATFQIGCINSRETIGIWLAGPSTAADLNGVDILSAHSAVMAVNLTAPAAQTIVTKEWQAYQAANTKVSYSYGSATLAYDDKKKTAASTFHVSQEGVQAHVEVVDSLGVTATGFPSCSTDTTYHYDTKVLEGLAAFLAPFLINEGLDFYIDGLAFTNSAQVYGIYAPGNGNITGSGVGCAFAGIVPTTILTPAAPTAPPGKLVFGFRQVSLSPTGGLTYFTQDVQDIPQHTVPRNPEILQAAPFQTYVYKSAAAAPRITTRLAIATRDLRQDPGTPIKVTWCMNQTGRVTPPIDPCSDKNVKLVSTADGGTFAQVSYPGLPASARTVGARTKLGIIAVTATDADKVTATATFNVYAIVENDPAGGPAKTSGKLIPK